MSRREGRAFDVGASATSRSTMTAPSAASRRARPPRIALTYDDGPTEHTPALLAVLTESGARATFFVKGASVHRNPDILRLIAATPGMEIGGHSLTHPDLWNVSDDQARDEVVDCQRLIESVIDRRVVLYRPPHGHHDGRTEHWARETGQSVILWTLTSMDWKHQSAPDTARIVARHARDGDVVLLHDTVASTVDGTRRFLAELSRRGYRFVTVTELLGTLTPGEVYSGRVWSLVRLARRIEGRTRFTLGRTRSALHLVRARASSLIRRDKGE